MPSFTFSGFASGSAVALSAAQGGLTAQNSVSTWGQGSLASLDILVTSAPVITAPAPIWLEAVELAGFAVPGGPAPGRTYDPSFHEITYVWRVQGSPLAPYSAPQNMVVGWNDPNVAYGKRAAFCFPDPGTYVVDLWAVDATGTTGTARATVVVAPADSLYPGVRTIVHAADGNFAGAPAGAVQVSGLQALQSAIHGAGAATRVLFKRGETLIDVDLISRPSGSNSGRIDHIGAWGTGSVPVLRPRRFDGGNMITWRSSGPETQITVENVRIEGWWNPETETGSLGGGSPLYWRDKTTSAKILLWNVEITGCDAQQLSANAAPCDIMAANCVVRNWQQYGFFVDKTRDGKLAFLGCRITQSSLALNGGPKKGMSNNHGPIRIVSCRWIVGDVCDLFSNDGWSGSYDCQPCLRIATHPTENLQIFVHWGRTVMENGYQIINLEGENAGSEDNPGNFVFDRLLLIGTSRQRATMVSVHKGGATFRNVLAVQPDTPAYVTGSNQFFDFEANNPMGTNDVEPVRVYNVTAVSLQSAANENSGAMTLVGSTGSFADVVAENNLLHAPSGAQPVTGSGPVDLSTPVPGVTPRYRGVRYNFEHPTGTLASGVPQGGSLTVPYAQILVRDQNGQGPGTPTSQAYWQATQGTDVLHMFSLNGKVMHAAAGQITVALGGSGVTITNTSGEPWEAGTNWWLALDRTSRLDAEMPWQTQYANPSSVPLATPLSGSPAAGGAGLGLTDPLDFYGAERTSPASRGALES